MARTKDRYLRGSKSPYEIAPINEKYRAGGYVRLSNDSTAKESDSIENQKYLIKEYVRKHTDIELTAFYEDDGFTGTNFKRSGFEKMMEAVRTGEINCIIVKDISRFGREHIRVGDYIEKVFPFLGVRFISLLDYYDSEDPVCDRERMLITIKSLFHEIYPRDISQKVYSSFREKRERGEAKRTNAIPYGYLMLPGDTRYRIDYRTYRIYKKIVGWYVAGKSIKTIVKLLYRKGVLTLTQYRKTGKVYQDGTVAAKLWSESVIYNMLRSRAYEGTLIQHKSEQRLFENIPQHSLPENEWQVIENAHTAILKHERFIWLQNIIGEREKKSVKEELPLWKSLEDKVFTDLLFCGDCDGRMKRRSQPKMVDGIKYRVYGYRCLLAERITGLCSHKWIYEYELCEIVLSSLQAWCLQVQGLNKKLEQYHKNSYAGVIAAAEKKLRMIHDNQKRLEMERIEAYTSYLEKHMDLAAFKLYTQRYHKKREEADKKEKELIKQVEYMKKMWRTQCRMVTEFLKYKKDLFQSRKEAYGRVTCGMLHVFINKIYIHEGKRVEIIFNFEEELQFLAQSVQDLQDGGKVYDR